MELRPVSYEDTFSTNGKGIVGIDITALGQYLADKFYTITLLDTIYYYKDGLYRRDGGFIDAEIVKHLDGCGYNLGKTGLIRDVKTQIRAINWTEEYPFDCIENIIPVANGVIIMEPDQKMLDIGLESAQIRLVDHSPTFRITKRLDVVYDPEIATDEIEEVLATWLDPEEGNFLVQIPALAIMQSWGGVYKIAYLLEGKRDAGKSSYCDLICNFFGTGKYSMADLSDLIKHRFAKAQLEGSYINIQDDLPGIPLTQIGKFKDLTGKIVHEVERKGSQPYTTRLSALHLYTCNEPPGVDFVDDDAFWSRWNYITFTGRFDRDPAFMKRVLRPEMLSAFLNLIIKEIVSIREDPKRITRMDADVVKELWTTAVDHIVQFINDSYTRDSEQTVYKDELYAKYVAWCENAKYTTQDKAKITRAIGRMGVTTVRLNRQGKRIHAYKGLKDKENHNPRLKSWNKEEAEVEAMQKYKNEPWARGDITTYPDENDIQKMNENMMNETFTEDESEYMYEVD